MCARGLGHPCISMSMLQRTLRRCAGSAENAENAENATLPRKNAEKHVCVMPGPCGPRQGTQEMQKIRKTQPFQAIAQKNVPDEMHCQWLRGCLSNVMLLV